MLMNALVISTFNTHTHPALVVNDVEHKKFYDSVNTCALLSNFMICATRNGRLMELVIYTPRAESSWHHFPHMWRLAKPSGVCSQQRLVMFPHYNTMARSSLTLTKGYLAGQ